MSFEGHTCYTYYVSFDVNTTLELQVPAFELTEPVAVRS